MNELENCVDVLNLLSELNQTIPEGASKEVEIDGIKLSFKKENDVIKIKIKKEEKDFDDSEIKDIIKEYKKNIESLDDDLFLEIVEELTTKIDLNKFNELLDLETFTEEKASKIAEMIDISVDIIASHLSHKIQRMVELYDSFKF